MIYSMLKDIAMWVYAVEALICLAGFSIFLWWWIRQKTASEVYAYITFLLLATCVERTAAFAMRYLIFYDITKAKEAIFSLAWVFRTFPGTVIMGLIVYRMFNRACRTIRLEKKYQNKKVNTCEEAFDDG